MILNATMNSRKLLWTLLVSPKGNVETEMTSWLGVHWRISSVMYPFLTCWWRNCRTVTFASVTRCFIVQWNLFCSPILCWNSVRNEAAYYFCMPILFCHSLLVFCKIWMMMLMKLYSKCSTFWIVEAVWRNVRVPCCVNSFHMVYVWKCACVAYPGVRQISYMHLHWRVFYYLVFTGSVWPLEIVCVVLHRKCDACHNALAPLHITLLLKYLSGRVVHIL